MIPLTLGCLFSDRVEALLDGRVSIAGVDLSIRLQEAQALFRAVLREEAFDMAELSIASHVAAVGSGRRAYRALPVFLSRSFRHSNVYVRSDRGIYRPEDLAGRRIGVIDYQQTAALWVRGILADDHGVDRTGCEWVAAGLHAPVLTDRAGTPPPPGIRQSRSAETLDALLRRGEIDAVISPTAPRCFAEGSAPVRRLWADPRAAELDWWRRTGVFPIMHVLVVRRSLAEAHPALMPAISAAFEQALALTSADLAARDFPKVALPWVSDHARETADALGGDPWTYGVEANRGALKRLLRYAAEDGLTPGVLSVEELFA